MNKRVEQYWNDFCVENYMEGTNYRDAFQFGVSADWLADLVVEGKKTATTSGYIFLRNRKRSYTSSWRVLYCFRRPG